MISRTYVWVRMCVRACLGTWGRGTDPCRHQEPREVILARERQRSGQREENTGWKRQGQSELQTREVPRQGGRNEEKVKGRKKQRKEQEERLELKRLEKEGLRYRR